MSLALRQVSARYGAIQVCRRIDLSVRAGEILAILGANGAGKSSLLGAVAGWVAGGGEVLLGEGGGVGRGARERARRGIALVPEGRRNLFMALTVDDNLRLGLRLLPAGRRTERRSELLRLFPILQERLAQRAGMLSGGEQQMLAIAVALAREPSVLLLDEPSQGLAPVILDLLVERIGALRGLGLSILLAEQNHRFAARLADRYLVLQGGEIAGSGSAADLQDHERALAALMGV